MTSLDTDTSVVSDSVDRRRHQRVTLCILGRALFESGREYPCRILNISPGGVALRSPSSGEVGEKVVAYVDHFGRLEGRIARSFERGFAMTIDATAGRRDKLADSLTWLANRNVLKLKEDRGYERQAPAKATNIMLKLADGSVHQCRVADVSMSGAAVFTDLRPDIGSSISVGRMHANVVRHFDEGIAVEFIVVQSKASIGREFS